eukprot:ANDGO_04347.mRNA.1 hypothetical protein
MLHNVVLVFAAALLILHSLCGGEEIKTRCGLLEGNTSCHPRNASQCASEFLGIPYAEPPVGRLRFLPSVPFGCWNGTLHASLHYALNMHIYE